MPNEIIQQFIEQNADQLPEMLKFVHNIRDQFKEIKTTEGIITAVLTAYSTIDTIQEEAFADNTVPISCVGCKEAYCCHQSVAICEAEAALIAQYCKENNIKIPRKHLQKQLAHSRDNIAYADCSACVFLKDNKCSIYPVHPAACRIHHVTTPLEFCDTKQYKRAKIGFVNNTAALLIQMVLFEEGGKGDRIPRLLLKYSQ